MRPAARASIALALLLAVFGTGYWTASRRNSRTAGEPGERKVLYWVDPMHPSYKSDKPGIAPDCGMQLVPVYADGSGPAGVPAAPSAGAVQMTTDKQQMFGVQVRAVERSSASRPIRTVGRVIPDENRTYRLLATSDGWVRRVEPHATTGALVRADQPLASFYAPEFLGAEQAYIYALNSFDRFQKTGNEPATQFALTKANIQQYADALRNLGMSAKQIDNLAKDRQLTQDILIVAPADGFILSRDITAGQYISRGNELFRVADMSRVWILADLIGQDAAAVRPGATARVTLPGRPDTVEARVANVLPQFDAVARTMKVRLEAANASLQLRAEMFVDVEFNVGLPAAVTVPVDAVRDSGLRKVVFVDAGNNYFEPRQVETGWRSGEQVEIVSGLKPGERIVVSGNFLIDSESRMKTASAGITTPVRDPVCGMDIDQDKAAASGLVAAHESRTFYFCSEDCKRKFLLAPGKYGSSRQ